MSQEESKENQPFPDPGLTLVEVAALHGAAVCMRDMLEESPPRSPRQKRLAAALLRGMAKLVATNTGETFR